MSRPRALSNSSRGVVQGARTTRSVSFERENRQRSASRPHGAAIRSSHTAALEAFAYKLLSAECPGSLAAPPMSVTRQRSLVGNHNERSSPQSQKQTWILTHMHVPATRVDHIQLSSSVQRSILCAHCFMSSSQPTRRQLAGPPSYYDEEGAMGLGAPLPVAGACQRRKGECGQTHLHRHEPWPKGVLRRHFGGRSSRRSAAHGVVSVV